MIYAKCQDVKSVSIERLTARLDLTSDETLFRIGRVLSFLLDI